MLLIKKIKKFYPYIIIADIFLIGFIFYQLFYARHYWEGDNEKRFSISAGKNLDEIIKDLDDEDIISDALLFKIAVKLSGKESSIISKDYLFLNGMNNSELIFQLTDKNTNQLIRMTIPPGYTLKQISKLAEKKLSLSKDKFIKEASNDSLINIIGLKGQIKNLEGFLFPNTYDVAPSITEKKLVEILFNEFRKKIYDNDDIRSDIEKRQTTLLKALTLASIIEGETKLDAEKPVIAGVYLNRIEKNMRLEADPTVQYALPDGPKQRLLFEDLKIKSPYNTYLNKGLPPGPINNPGFASIKAALNPEEHNYIFFVANGEGGHKFSENYEQHQAAIREYKEKLRKKNSNK
ncbi:MAG: endolytic transglycosylase MltG [bacterium]|nr:endolytic transglycosylase MltG [bacterium]